MSDQLAALASLAATFDANGIDYWLFGGWAVDFYAGRITREHGDIDLAIWLSDMPRIATLIESDGWVNLDDPDADGGVAFAREGIRLELTYLHRDGDEIYTPLRDGSRGHWSLESLGSDVEEFGGVRARVVALAPLTRMKGRPRREPGEGAKDRADFAVLSDL